MKTDREILNCSVYRVSERDCPFMAAGHHYLALQNRMMHAHRVLDASLSSMGASSSESYKEVPSAGNDFRNGSVVPFA